jgi:hypothetical protein
MTKSPKQPRQCRPRHRTRESGLPQLAAQLPKDFRSPTAVNAFIYSLTVEFTAGRVDSRKAAVLGYLSQLAIQTLPLLRIEDGPDGRESRPFQFTTYVPRPNYPDPATLGPETVQDQANKEAALRSLLGKDQ